MTGQIIINGVDQTERFDRFKLNLRRIGLENSIARRFDRCCHPGKPGDGVLFFRRLSREVRSSGISVSA